MRSILLVGLAGIALLLAAGATAEECVPTTSRPEVSVGGIYIDNDLCQPQCLFSFVMYQESNYIEGLQRGDDMKDDTCGGQIERDSAFPCDACFLLPLGMIRRRDAATLRASIA